MSLVCGRPGAIVGVWAMKILFLIASMFGLTCLASTNVFVPHWTANCSVGSSKVVFSFDSKSGKADEDDMSINMTIGNKKQKVEIKESLFETINFNFKSKCDRLPAIVLDNQLLILIGINSRPEPTKIAALVVDLKNGKIIHMNKNMGQLEGEAKIEGNAMVISAIQNPTDDERKPVFTGSLKIFVEDGTIKHEWLSKLPTRFK